MATTAVPPNAGHVHTSTQSVGAVDYLAICAHFHTVFLHDVPLIRLPADRNAARRFITLIDTLYDHRVCPLHFSSLPRARECVSAHCDQPVCVCVCQCVCVVCVRERERKSEREREKVP